MGTLYVVGAPAGDPDDITRRALRILGEVALVIADDVGYARQLLTRHGIATPLSASADLDPVWDLLAASDVALLASGRSPAPSGPGCLLVRTAIERGFSVVPVPGPALPVTALVLSGLPTDNFVHLGELPLQPSARHDLLALVTSERRTLVAQASSDRLPPILAELRDIMGDRPLTIVVLHEQGIERIWQGTVDQGPGQPWDLPGKSPCVLVIGGERAPAACWDDERIRAEIQARLDQGLGAKEISQQLAVESGWPRREIYRLAVETTRGPRNK